MNETKESEQVAFVDLNDDIKCAICAELGRVTKANWRGTKKCAEGCRFTDFLCDECHDALEGEFQRAKKDGAFYACSEHRPRRVPIEFIWEHL